MRRSRLGDGISKGMRLFPAIGMIISGLLFAQTRAAAELVLVENGVSKAPIVIFENAPPFTRQAADELADYIEKTSGARPEVIEGLPQSVPPSAIWVGYQPVLEQLFPGLDFNFTKHEEILIAANNRHLVIAGRDDWDPDNMVFSSGRNTIHGIQQEYGTVNAVYTFLQDFLGVRWLWPGDLGEDILKQPTIAFDPFEYRYYPQVRGRMGLFPYSTLFRGGRDWMRFQRLQLDSLGNVGGGHGFGGWWDRFHETHPEYFALQPDGTRSGFPGPRTVKMCMSNPDVAERWIELVAEEREQNPNQRIFNASPNDGWFSGHCVCEECLAWDHPEGEFRRMAWEGIVQDYLALSDRDVKFANRVGRMLKERYPDEELYVYMLSYGHSRPAPLGVVPDDNVMIGNVANFLLRSEEADRGSTTGKTHKQNFADWGKITDFQFWRPNTGSPVGWQEGFPDVPLRRTMEDLKFVAENGWIGIYVDYVREFWATQGPMYYLMTQLTWNPGLDGEEILKDYYHRAFGPAAGSMEAYWNTLEELREEYYNMSISGGPSMGLAAFYTPERLAGARSLIEQAKRDVANAPEIYRKRIDYVTMGLDYTELLAECGRLMRLIRQDSPEADQAREKIYANWARIREFQAAYPDAMRWQRIFQGSRGDGPPTLRSYYPQGN